MPWKDEISALAYHIHREFDLRARVIDDHNYRFQDHEARVRAIERILSDALPKLRDTSRDIDAHDKRITYLERVAQAGIYVAGALMASQSGQAAEIMLAILKAKP